MLNAIVSTKENSAVIEFPLDLYELYHQLNQIGITQGPHRIKIIDDDNAAVRVKLCSESDFGNHVIRLINEKDTLEDLHTVVGAINIAPNEVKEELEEYILHDQLDNKEELYNALRELKESIAPIVTTFYCPLTAQIHDDEYGEMCDADDRAIRNAQYEIQEAIEKLMEGRTSFVIAHRLSTIRQADVILVVQNGTIVERGTHAELLAQKEYYYKLYTRQYEEEVTSDYHNQ